MNALDKHYLSLLEDILEYGTKKQTRNGEVLSIFGRQIRHRMNEGFPLLTTKKMAWKSIVTELLWFLRGDTNIKYLVDNDCHIWDGDAYKNWFENGRTEFDQFADPMFMSDDALGKEKFHEISMKWFIDKIKTDDEFAKKWGELGPIYGKQWRSWKKSDSFIVEDDVWKNNEGWCSLKDFNKDELYIDQIQNLINDLKTNPDSRRLLVSAWNVGELDQMVLPPCHYSFQVYTRELSLEERNEYYTSHYLGLDCNSHEELNKLGDIPTRAISLIFNMRSVDTPLGLPFNIASYGLLLEILGKITNMVPDELIGNLGDSHIYLNQIEGVKEQIGREPYPLPKLNINTEWWPTESGECGVGPIDAQAVLRSFSNDAFCKYLMEEDLQLYNYKSHPKIAMPLSN